MKFTEEMKNFAIKMKEIGFNQEDTTVMLMFLNEENLLGEMMKFLNEKDRTEKEVINKEEELMKTLTPFTIETIIDNEKEIPMLEKAKYVSSRVKKFNVYPKVLAHSLSEDNLEKAYKLLIDFPNITKEEYLEIMGLEE